MLLRTFLRRSDTTAGRISTAGIASATALVLLAAACGGNDSVSKAEYQAQLTAVGDKFETAGQDIFGVNLNSLGTASQARDHLLEGARLMRQTADEIAAITPPEDVRDPHAKLIEGFRKLGDAIEGAAAAFGDPNFPLQGTIGSFFSGDVPGLAEIEEARQGFQDAGYEFG